LIAADSADSIIAQGKHTMSSSAASNCLKLIFLAVFSLICTPLKNATLYSVLCSRGIVQLSDNDMNTREWLRCSYGPRGVAVSLKKRGSTHMRPVHRMKMLLMSQVETDRGQVPWRISSLRPSLLKSCQQVCFPAERERILVQQSTRSNPSTVV
jgi:hypothetical protein